jgi:hypothetical protein
MREGFCTGSSGSPGQGSQSSELVMHVRVNVVQKGISTHIIPYDAML